MKPFPYLLLALLAAGCDILEEDLSDRTVQILSPVPDATVTPGAVAFSWAATRRAAGYEFTVATPAFPLAERIVTDTVIFADTLSRHYGCSVELAEGAYEWRVRAFNGAYTTRMETYALTVRAEEPAPDPTDRTDEPDKSDEPDEPDESGPSDPAALQTPRIAEP